MKRHTLLGKLWWWRNSRRQWKTNSAIDRKSVLFQTSKKHFSRYEQQAAMPSIDQKSCPGILAKHATSRFVCEICLSDDTTTTAICPWPHAPCTSLMASALAPLMPFLVALILLMSMHTRRLTQKSSPFITSCGMCDTRQERRKNDDGWCLGQPSKRLLLLLLRCSRPFCWYRDSNYVFEFPQRVTLNPPPTHTHAQPAHRPYTHACATRAQVVIGGLTNN